MAIIQSHLLLEKVKERSLLNEAMVVLGASVIIALFAPISFRLPFSPVPIATQLQVILLLSCLLGSRRSALAVITYLFQGCIGLPVFAAGGAGILTLAGPTGGYLLGYLIAAYMTGFIAERISSRAASKTFAAMSLGNIIVYCFGSLWLSRFIGFEKSLLLGVLPFIVGDVFKLVLATKLLKKLKFHL